MQDGRNWHFTDFDIFAYFYFLVSILLPCEIFMTMDNDNIEKYQSVCTKSELSLQERRKSQISIQERRKSQLRMKKGENHISIET